VPSLNTGSVQNGDCSKRKRTLGVSAVSGVLQMRTSALFGAREFRFFEIYGVSAQTRVEGLSQC